MRRTSSAGPGARGAPVYRRDDAEQSQTSRVMRRSSGASARVRRSRASRRLSTSCGGRGRYEAHHLRITDDALRAAAGWRRYVPTASCLTRPSTSSTGRLAGTRVQGVQAANTTDTRRARRDDIDTAVGPSLLENSLEENQAVAPPGRPARSGHAGAGTWRR